MTPDRTIDVGPVTVTEEVADGDGEFVEVTAVVTGDGSGQALPPIDPDEVTRAAAEALEAGHRPLLGLGAAIFDVPRRFLLNRYKDEAGTTGVGAVAWGCVWPSGRVSLDWQTEHAMRGGYYDDMESVLALHGKDTALEWLDK